MSRTHAAPAEVTAVDRIRTIFLHEEPHVSTVEGAALLGWTEEEMTKAIRGGEVEVMTDSAGERICARELMAKALEVWPLDAIEEALGADADRILPPELRLVDLHARIPRVYAAMLEHFATAKRISVSAIVTRTLDGMASARSRELSRRIAGFAAALKWPES